MFRITVCALALGALALSPTLASAKSGNHNGTSANSGNKAPTTQTQSPGSKPELALKRMKILHCGKYARGNGYGPVTYETICY